MMKAIRAWAALLGVSLLALGCRAPTPEERDNRRLVDAVLTAITLKNTRLLDESNRRLERRHREGHLTDEQYKKLQAVIGKGRVGDWAGAERDGYEFRKEHPFVREGR